MKKILCVKIVYIVKVVPKIIFEIVVKKELFVKVICIIKVMIQIYLSEGACKKLCVKVILRSYYFPKKKTVEKKVFFKKRNSLAVGNRSLGALMARAR